MNPLFWIANRVRRVFTPNISGKPIIALQPFPSLQRIYTDILNVIRSGDPCDEKGSVYYLRSDVRYKIGEPAIWPAKDLRNSYSDYPHITIGGTELVSVNGFMTFQEFITLETLADVIIEIMKTPFRVVLYDLDENKKEYPSWYKDIKEEIGTEKLILERIKSDPEKAKRFSERFGEKTTNFKNLLANLEDHTTGYNDFADLIRKYCTKKLNEIDTTKEDIALMVEDERCKLMSDKSREVLDASTTSKRIKKYYEEMQKELADICEVIKEDPMKDRPKGTVLRWCRTRIMYTK